MKPRLRPVSPDPCPPPPSAAISPCKTFVHLLKSPGFASIRPDIMHASDITWHRPHWNRPQRKDVRRASLAGGNRRLPLHRYRGQLDSVEPRPRRDEGGCPAPLRNFSAPRSRRMAEFSSRRSGTRRRHSRSSGKNSWTKDREVVSSEIWNGCTRFGFAGWPSLPPNHAPCYRAAHFARRIADARSQPPSRRPRRYPSPAMPRANRWPPVNAVAPGRTRPTPPQPSASFAPAALHSAAGAAALGDAGDGRRRGPQTSTTEAHHDGRSRAARSARRA